MILEDRKQNLVLKYFVDIYWNQLIHLKYKNM